MGCLVVGLWRKYSSLTAAKHIRNFIFNIKDTVSLLYDKTPGYNILNRTDSHSNFNLFTHFFLIT
jgi:hypothetical protein